ncbi:hypothetical protein LPJ59_000502 [Coemansia sp. RSA 2399]|nr:hypothetical protein LPJ59_000502 [Coemansia sp. RSA 2399]KAJ1908008.1 hypothetical protein LPJ81_000382 [Coemansia sp. IMI 209127]
MTQNNLNGARLPDNKASFAPSSALDAADLQFSGYLLNGSGHTNNSIGGFSRNYYSCAPNSGYSSAQSDKSNGSSGGNGAHLLGSLGIANTHSFGTQQPGGSRYASIASPTIGRAMRTPGNTNPSSEPSSYNASSHHGFSSANNMPLLGYNSYASLLNKANLMFESNLDTMMIDWTLEERECCRRLVQFWRRHENNNIFCTFKAVAAADRVPNSIVVSCIYWEEKQDFFITSVDCIHLLESLIAVRFTVEEKNRIRRNLEGFRPLTVSKCKSESADFFKLIMSFPNPKPRNIEKDVKVFPWRILPLALKKIIGKYTASYSSTASIALDSYPTSRSTCYSQLAGMPISTAAGGMPTFASLTSAPGHMLGALSASAAVVAAAAAAASAEKSQQFGSMSITAPQPTANVSLLSAYDNPGPNAGFGSPLGTSAANNSSKLRGFHMIPQSTIASSTSVPASDSSDQDYSSLLLCGGPKTKMSRPATTPYISNAGDSKHGYVDTRQDPVKADQPDIPSFMLSQGNTNQLDFAGMAAENPMPFLASDFAVQQMSAAQLYSSDSILDQLAAGYGLSRSNCTLQPPENQVRMSTPSSVNVTTPQQQQQRVARSSSTKRNAMQHTPYITERADRRRTDNCRGSPSIPLILEQQQQQQQQNVLNSLVNIETASSASSTMTFGESTSTSIDGASGHVDGGATGRDNGIRGPVVCGALKKALLGLSGGITSTRADFLSGDHQSVSSNDDTADGCGGGAPVAMVDSGAFDTMAASTSAEMFSFGLDGDFSFLANLIAASGDGSSSSNNSSSALAPEGPTAAGDTQTADIFSLVHLSGGPALSTIDGRGRSDPQQ